MCDKQLLGGWYRFVGAAGTKMPTTRVQPFRCGTYWSGWLNGTHPTVEDGEVSRMVCFSDKRADCRHTNIISVKNCGYYYVYKLFKTPICPSRYCGADWNTVRVVRGFIRIHRMCSIWKRWTNCQTHSLQNSVALTGGNRPSRVSEPRKTSQIGRLISQIDSE